MPTVLIGLFTNCRNRILMSCDMLSDSNHSFIYGLLFCFPDGYETLIMIIYEMVGCEFEPIGGHWVQHPGHSPPPPERLLAYFRVHIIRTRMFVRIIFRFAAGADVVAHVESAWDQNGYRHRIVLVIHDILIATTQRHICLKCVNMRPACPRPALYI